MTTSVKRRIAVWSIAASGAVAPVAAFLVSLSAAQRSRPGSDGLHQASMILNAPGAMPGLMFRSWVVQLVASALFWGILLGAAGAAAFVPWKERGSAMRTVTLLAVPTMLYGVLVSYMFANWNPD